MTETGITVKQEISLTDASMMFSKSGFFKDARQAAQAGVKLMIGQELGLSAYSSMGLHIVEGKIELSSGAMAALIKSSGIYKFKIVTLTAERCELSWTERETPADKWEKAGPNTIFTIEDAKRAGLIKPKSGWEKYPEDMCFARCLSRGFRRYCAELAAGAVYVQGEISDRVPVEITAEVVSSETGQGSEDEEPLVPEPAESTESPVTPDQVPEGDNEAKAEETQEEPAGEPQEHPYGIFCRKAEALKTALAGLLNSQHAEDVYRAVFNEFGPREKPYQGRGDVPKGATGMQDSIIARLEEFVFDAEADAAVDDESRGNSGA